MKWQVTWRTLAENKLANMWINEPDRAEIAAAADSIDQLLENDPLGQGESRGDSLRIHFQPPLAVLYEVDEINHAVFVLSIGRSKPSQ